MTMRTCFELAESHQKDLGRISQEYDDLPSNTAQSIYTLPASISNAGPNDMESDHVSVGNWEVDIQVTCHKLANFLAFVPMALGTATIQQSLSQR